jgi:hypothetical protein
MAVLVSVFHRSLADGTIASSKTTIYTAPAGLVAYPRFLSLFNTNASDQTILVYLKRSGSSSRTLRRYVLAQYESALVFDKDDDLALSAGDEIEAETTNASAVEYVLTGATANA